MDFVLNGVAVVPVEVMNAILLVFVQSLIVAFAVVLLCTRVTRVRVIEHSDADLVDAQFDPESLL